MVVQQSRWRTAKKLHAELQATWWNVCGARLVRAVQCPWKTSTVREKRCLFTVNNGEGLHMRVAKIQTFSLQKL